MQAEGAGSGGEIAIVGMACLFAQAPDLVGFWRNILTKVDGTGQPSASWSPERYLDPTGRSSDRLYTTSGGFLGDLYRFDPLAYGIMPGSVDGQEPDQFIALRVARDALADAGYLDRPFDRSRTGVILGHSTYLNRAQANAVQFGVVLDQTLEILEGLHPGLDETAKGRIRELLKSKLAPFNADTGPGLVPNVMTGRIANRLDLGGPNYLIDAACASSLLSIQAGVEELRSGRSDMMLAGGVNASTPAEAFLVFCQLGALSRRSRIRPFDTQADGTLLGEGAGVVVLKRYADALRDKDRIYALVRGVGQSSDGRGAGLLAPRLDGEVLALRRGYQEAGVEPHSVSLVEAHGTGIPLGDRTEIQALRTVFGDRSPGAFPDCAIGSVKSMICHCIPAAGVAGAIKTALSLYYKVLPPTLCEEVNPELGLDQTSFYVNTEIRPWIHQRSQARRAAVNSFGFGGINAHCILEETPPAAPDAQPRLAHWPTELVVLTASDRARLLSRVERVADSVAALQGDQVSLADIAYTLAGQADSGAHRLAIVADDLGDLSNKLRRAAELLVQEDKHRIQTRSGIYFADRRLEGRLAFMFPGEGAQYTNMLADLATSFPVVRHWFDLWDSIFEGSRSFAPSSIVFPPPTGLDEEQRRRADDLIYGLELGSESVFIASQALFELLTHFGLQPDAVVGHSSGENTALVAVGALDLGGPGQLRAHVMRLNRMYRDMEAAGEVATGKLLTVGAVARRRILALLDEFSGRLHLALDNCQHQAVLYGAADDVEAAANMLRREGGLCSYLPFDRAYHTPLFEPVARLVDRFYSQVSFSTPRLPIYSCVTAAPFPDDPEEIRQLAVLQWQSRVRFTETIERLHDDGFRFLVEVGPSSNLTNFVDDILRGKDYFAAPVNNRNRPGLAQLQHLLGRLFVGGRSLALDYLFAGRGCRNLDLDEPRPAQVRAPLIANTLPYIRLAPQELEEIRGLLRLSGETAKPATAPYCRQEASPPGQMSVPATAVPPVMGLSALAPAGDGLAGGELTAAITDYLTTMQAFLHNQEHVLTAAFAAPVAASPAYLPLIHRVTSRGADRVEVECDFDVGQTFVRHHTLYASQVSEQDPGLTALPVVPLTVSLELLAETGSLLAEGIPLIGLERVRAYNWVAIDEGDKTVRAVGERVAHPDGATRRVSTALFEGEQMLLEADILFAGVPPNLAAPLPALSDPRDPVWQDRDLYTRGMFHGPLFHSVKGLLAWDDTGIDAELAATPTAGFFVPGDRPEFLLNPVLLDAVGHVAAFWVAQRQGTDFSSFPSRIERIAFRVADTQDTAGCQLRGRLSFLGGDGTDARFLEGDYECVDRAGDLLFRIQGWRDRFFSVPHRFYLARTNPREAWLGEDWSGLFPDHAAAGTLVWSMPGFAPGFLDDAGGVWRRLLAHTFLSAEERSEWFELRTPPRRLNDWLMARIALKEGVRRWLFQRTGRLVFPADVVISSELAGRPYVSRNGLDGLIDSPEVSVTHAGGMAIAAICDTDRWIGIDMETKGAIILEDLMQSAFTEAERQRIASADVQGREVLALSLWCTKEAAGKSLGLGLAEGPHAFAINDEDMIPDKSLDRLTVRYGGHLVPVSVCVRGERVIALANVDPK